MAPSIGTSLAQEPAAPGAAPDLRWIASARPARQRVLERAGTPCAYSGLETTTPAAPEKSARNEATSGGGTAPSKSPPEQRSSVIDCLEMESLLKKLYGWHGPLLVDQGFTSHLGWGFAVPLFGYWVAGVRGLYLTGTAWSLYALYRELIEEPYDATTVSDLFSRIAPVLLIFTLQLALRRAGARRAALR